MDFSDNRNRNGRTDGLGESRDAITSKTSPATRPRELLPAFFMLTMKIHEQTDLELER